MLLVLPSAELIDNSSFAELRSSTVGRGFRAFSVSGSRASGGVFKTNFLPLGLGLCLVLVSV